MFNFDLRNMILVNLSGEALLLKRFQMQFLSG